MAEGEDVPPVINFKTPNDVTDSVVYYPQLKNNDDLNFDNFDIEFVPSSGSGTQVHFDFTDQTQFILFLKNIGLAGGFLFIVANGTKEWSVDKEKKYVRL